MIHAGSNFSHMLAQRKLQGHVLVTGGIYKRVLVFTHSYFIDADFRMAQMVPSSIVRWVLLLGTWNSTRASESAQFHGLCYRALEILPQSNSRFVVAMLYRSSC